jgi:hypothetical protein
LKLKRTNTLRKAHTTTWALAWTLAVTSSAALADIVDISWDAGGRFERSLNVAPSKFVEACGKLPAGAKVRWRFEASAPLDFNVHYHVGKEVEFPTKLVAVASARDTLNTQTQQDYCWMWSNKSAAAAALTVELQR